MTRITRAASVGPAMNDQRMLAKGQSGLQRSDASAGMDQGLRVLSYLTSGVLFYGALGWLGDHLLGTGFLLPIGIVAGAAFGVYVVIRRFGQVPEPVIDKPQLESSRSQPATDPTEGAL